MSDSSRSGPAITWRPVATHPLLGTAVGVAAALTAGLAMIPARETLGPANAALVMAAITVVAAEFGGRTAGVVVGIAGSLVFNVLHTAPYLRLHIYEASDIIAAVLLAAFGLLVASWHRRPSGR